MTTMTKTITGNTRVLQGKHAVIFGAAGSIGSAVAKEFAVAGAELSLAGRNKSHVEEIAKQIEAAGGKARASAVDALDDSAVNKYIDSIVKHSGKLDVVFNATGPLAKEYGNGKNAVELPIEEFMVPMNTVVKAHFISARAAARHMIKQRSGVIIFLTGSPARGHVPGATAIGAAFGAIETLMENLAVELSPAGVRVVCIRTTANVDSRTIQDSTEVAASKMNITQGEAIARIANLNFLKMPATVQDTANAAVLVASDRARMLTGTVVNATAGAALD